ncbi:multipass membrane protein [Candidatus Mancarchaeum acidiphilum]|uniref:Multipass membrane protein n=1 Tax=Candidatus Mancarchaeum acidiphilum TaxID=1920749 RepID=A0A218NNK0_9ARCH|nr:multipass membrane protein [Candidatus Mancarchaeum acidiphilum]
MNRFFKFTIPALFLILVVLLSYGLIYNQFNNTLKSNYGYEILNFGGAGGSSSSQCGLVPSSISKTISSNEPWYCPINEEIFNDWQTYLPIAVIVLLIGLFVDIIIFGIGVALKNDRVRNIGVGELYETFASAIIIFLFLYICAVTFGLIPGVYVGNINPYATAFHLMLTTSNSVEKLYTGLFHTYAMDKFITSIEIKFYGSNLGDLDLNTYGQYIYGVAYTPLEIGFIEPASFIMSMLIDGTAILYSEYYLLVFFSVSAIPVFIIPGVIFRIIPPTRGLGGMMIALGIAFYLVFPTLFAAVYYFSSSSFLTQISVATLQAEQINSQGIASAKGFSSTSPAAENLSSIQSSMSSFWLLVLFYPALIIAVSYAFVQTIAQFISGSTYSSRRIRGFV